MRNIFNKLKSLREREDPIRKCQLEATIDHLKKQLAKAEQEAKEYKQKNAPLGAFTALEVQQWLKSPITKKMVRTFENLRLGISNGVAQGRCTKETLPVMIGKCQGIEEIIQIMEDVQGDDRKEHIERILSLYLFNIFNEEK